MITLKINDIEIPNLTMNGNNYVSEEKINTSNWPAIFELEATGTVPGFEDGEEIPFSEHFDHAKLIQQVTYTWDEGKWYLAFAPVSAQEFSTLQQNSKIEYIAMMTDVELEDV